MARFAFNFLRVFFGAKFIDALIAVSLLSAVASRSIRSDVVKITDDRPMKETNVSKNAVLTASSVDMEDNLVFKEFFDIVMKLAEESETYTDEGMQGDQPMDRNFRNDENETKSENSDISNEMKLAQREALEEIKRIILEATGRTSVNSTNGSFPSRPIISTLPIIHSDYLQKTEAIPPICPIKNEENLTLTFDISEPKISSKEMILGVLSAELKLYKIPLKMSTESIDEDDSAESQLRETFQKSDINVSERVIKTKIEEERRIQITVYKIRNKNKSYELKKLDTKMVPASFEGITTWNVKAAVNIWGRNNTKRNLRLLITVEDDSRKHLLAKNVFRMRCAPNLAKPIPLDSEEPLSENSHTAWINLTTEERPAKVDAYNAAASTMNRLVQDRARTGASSWPQKTSRSKGYASFEDKLTSD